MAKSSSSKSPEPNREKASSNNTGGKSLK
jgi:hypothetical protein